MKSKVYLFSLLLLCAIFSCVENEKSKQENDFQKVTAKENQSQMTMIMKTHLDAVSQKDLETLKSTMSPHGDMQLILPESEIIEGVDGFMLYHEEWFAIDNGWTFETKILNTKTGTHFGYAIVEIVYREPDRDGEPYFNRMIVSYDLERINNHWYVVKDHASSIEKSTDNP